MVKWILRYLKITSDYALCFGRNNVQLEGFIDLDLVRDLDTHKSTTGYAFIFVKSIISWSSRLQHSITLSTIEVEYMALLEGVREMIWL